MKLRPFLSVSMIFGFLLLLAGAAGAVTTPVASLEWATRVIDEVLSVPMGGISNDVLARARAMAIFPAATRSQLTDGGELAEGVIVARNPDGTWSNPGFLNLREYTSGPVRSHPESDFILVFTSPEAVDALERGALTLGTNVTVAPGPVADRKLDRAPEQAQVYSYSRGQRKSLAGFPLTGVVMKYDRAASGDLYDTRGITLKEIFTSKRLTEPVGAGRIKCTISMHTRAAQMCG